MNRQGLLGVRLSHARKLAMLAATALIALAAPAAANAATPTISAEYDSGEDTVFVYVDGDNTDSNVTVTGTTATTISIGGVQSTGDSYCNGGGTVVCTFAADDYVVLIASLGGGTDNFNASGSTGIDLHLNILGEGGLDSLTGSPFADYIEGGAGPDAAQGLAGEDYLNMHDGEADLILSDCGADLDLLDRDSVDPAVDNCEDVATFDPAPPPPPPPPPPGLVDVVGKFNGKTLTVSTSGPGVIAAGPASTAGASRAQASAAKKKVKPLIASTKLKVSAGGIFKLPVKLTSAGKKQLKKKKKLKAKVKVTFTPTAGAAASKTVSVTFKKKK